MLIQSQSAAGIAEYSSVWLGWDQLVSIKDLQCQEGAWVMFPSVMCHSLRYPLHYSYSKNVCSFYLNTWIILIYTVISSGKAFQLQHTVILTWVYLPNPRSWVALQFLTCCFQLRIYLACFSSVACVLDGVKSKTTSYLSALSQNANSSCVLNWCFDSVYHNTGDCTAGLPAYVLLPAAQLLQAS